MTAKHAFVVVGRLFRPICNSDQIFGGKLVIVSDYSTLPVVRHRKEIIENSVKSSHL